MGRVQFDRQSVIRSLPGRAVVLIPYASTAAVAVGQTLGQSFYAPTGKVATLIGAEFVALPVPGATVGTHEIRLALENGADGIQIMSYINAYNQQAGVYDFEPYASAGNAHPADVSAITQVLTHLMFDSALCLTMRYINNSDVASTAQRYAYMIVAEEDVS